MSLEFALSVYSECSYSACIYRYYEELWLLGEQNVYTELARGNMNVELVGVIISRLGVDQILADRMGERNSNDDDDN